MAYIYYVNNFHRSGVQAWLSSVSYKATVKILARLHFPLEFRVFFQTNWGFGQIHFIAFIGLRSTGPRGYPQFSSMWPSPYTVHIIVAYIFKISRRVSTNC